MIIGAQFGTSADLDAYLAVPRAGFAFPTRRRRRWAALSSTFTAYWVKDDRRRLAALQPRAQPDDAADRRAGRACALCAAARAACDRTRFPPEQQALTANLMRWMMISTVIFGASGLVMALNAMQHFLLPRPRLSSITSPSSSAVAAGAAHRHLRPRGGRNGRRGRHLLVQIPGLARRRASPSTGPCVTPACTRWHG